MSTGALGLLAHCVLVARVLRGARAGGDFASFAGVANPLVFSVLHYVLRHPVFWFYLILAAGREPAPGRNRDRAPVGRSSVRRASRRVPVSGRIETE